MAHDRDLNRNIVQNHFLLKFRECPPPPPRGEHVEVVWTRYLGQNFRTTVAQGEDGHWHVFTNRQPDRDLDPTGEGYDSYHAACLVCRRAVISVLPSIVYRLSQAEVERDDRA